MASFNPLDPDTFVVSKTNQTSNYAYTVRVNPTDPTTYQGPPFVTVSSSQLLSEEQILDIARTFTVMRAGHCIATQNIGFELTEGKINKDIIGGE